MLQPNVHGFMATLLRYDRGRDDCQEWRGGTEEAILMIYSLPNLHNKSVLDVGCGEGRYIPFFEACGARKIVGVDRKKETIQECRRRFPEHMFICADLDFIQPLWLGDSSVMNDSHFDFIWAHDLFHSLPRDRKRALFRLLLTRLKPGGMFLMNDYQPNTYWFDIWYKLLSLPFHPFQIMDLPHRIFVGHFASGGYHETNYSFYLSMVPEEFDVESRLERWPEVEVERTRRARFCDWLVGGHRMYIAVTRS